jgi:hypothetical protein
MTVEVQVLVDGHTEILSSEEITILPAAEVILAIRPFSAAGVRLDGRVRMLSGGVDGLVALDLSRSTGFHHLHVPPGHDFWFGTEDAKTGLAGVEAMLQYLRSSGTGWSGQLLFSDGAYLRDDHVVYAWLDNWADRILRAARQIARSPRRGRTSTERVTTRGGRRVSLAATIGLFRTSPAKYLEPSASGPIVSGTRRYVPRKVVVRAPTTTLNTLANQRAWWILRKLSSLANDVDLRSAPTPQSHPLTIPSISEQRRQENRARIGDWKGRVGAVIELGQWRAIATMPLNY